MQVDNPLQNAVYPVMAACPTIPQRFGMSIGASTPAGKPVRSAAFTTRMAVWNRRPAGVICLEHIEVSSHTKHVLSP